MISWYIADDGGKITVSENDLWFQSMFTEVLGSFVVAFFYLSQTENKTMFTKDKSINCFIIASAYIAARAMCGAKRNTSSGACLNPAVAIGTSFTQLFSQGGPGFKWVWLYGGLPFAGSILAVIFFEFVFKKTQEVLNEDEDEDVDSLLDK